MHSNWVRSLKKLLIKELNAQVVRTQRKYNQGTKVGNTIINILLSEFQIKKYDQSKFPFRGTGGFIPPMPPHHLRSLSVQ